MPEDTDSAMTWQERETLDALRRLANARSQLAQLEEQAAAEAADPAVDPADVERVEALRAEVAELEPRSRSRFGGSAARQRIAELEAEVRLVLQRVGVADLDELRARAAAPTTAMVDPTVLEFAQRELAAAEAAWLEVQAFELAEPESEDADGADVAEPAAAPDEGSLASVTEIDLRMKPPAAS